MFEEAAAAPSAAGDEPPPESPEAAIKPRNANHNGRRRLPAHLPREPRRHELLTPEERACPCCGEQRTEIGDPLGQDAVRRTLTDMPLHGATLNLRDSTGTTRTRHALRPRSAASTSVAMVIPAPLNCMRTTWRAIESAEAHPREVGSVQRTIYPSEYSRIDRNRFGGVGKSLSSEDRL